MGWVIAKVAACYAKGVHVGLAKGTGQPFQSCVVVEGRRKTRKKTEVIISMIIAGHNTGTESLRDLFEHGSIKAYVP